jgi:hypothetical protein
MSQTDLKKTEPEPEPSLVDALVGMKKHSQENPTHGYNCACKDQFLRQARKFLDETDLWVEASYLFRVLGHRY